MYRSVTLSDCKIIDCGSYVHRVRTKSDGKVEKVTISLAEEKGEITYGHEDHDVEHVTAIFKHPYRHDVHRKHPRQFDMQTDIVTETRSAMTKLTVEIEE